MKGFKDKSGKFRPTENKNGVRKSRDQSTKTQGIKLERKARDSDFIEEPEEYELYDILEDVTGKDHITHEIDTMILEKVMKENIQEILVREKKWGEGYHIVFPVGARQYVREETSKEEFERTGNGESGFYQYDFEVFKNPHDVIYQGTSWGDISHGDMIDMTLVTEEKNRMKRDVINKGIEPLEPFSLRRREHLLSEDQLSRDFSFDQLDQLKSEIDNDLSTRYFDLNPNADYFSPQTAFKYAKEKGNRLDPDFDILLTERRKVLGATNKKTMRSLGGVVKRDSTGFPEVDEMIG